MSWGTGGNRIPGALAGASFATTGQFLFVRLHTENPDAQNAENTYVVCTAVGDDPVGVAQNNPASGGALEVQYAGIAKVYAGGTIKVGDEVGTDAAGKAVSKAATSTGANYGQFVRGVALKAASSGDLVAILLRGPYRVH